MDLKPAGGDETLGMVDFSIFPGYAIDDQTAIQVAGDKVEVVSGELEVVWEVMAAGQRRSSRLFYCKLLTAHC